MIKLKVASKRSELHCNWVRWLIWKLEHLVNTPRLAILMIKVCWGNWNVSPHAGTIHMTCTVIYYEITLEKCICVSRSILSTVPPNNKLKWMISCKHECLGEVMVVIDLFLTGCTGSDDCNVHLLAFKLALIVTIYHIYLSKVEAGGSITCLPLFGFVWLYNFAVQVTTW